MAAFANTENLDMVLTYVLVQKLLTRINNTKAYELGLVDNNGIVIKSPEGAEEEESLGMLDKFIFKLKRMLGPKLNQLSNFLYVNSLDSDITKFLTVKGGVQNRASVKRVKMDVDKLAESYNMTTDQLIICLIEGVTRDAK
tara:strand:- start:15853 stop:16275 length:423 start_codon:yes stop_codon:yes gene_type:complete